MGSNFGSDKRDDSNVISSFIKKISKSIEGIKDMNKKMLVGIVASVAVLVTGFAVYFVTDSSSKDIGSVQAKEASQKEGFVQTKNDDEKKDEDSKKTTTSDKKSDANSVAGVVENVMPAIVSINTETESTAEFFGRSFGGSQKGSGSGIIVGQEGKNIMIATNNHVVEGANSVSVVFCDEKEVKASVKGTDKRSDLAVVCVNMNDMENETKDAIKIASLGDSTKCKVGEMTIAIGNALGYGQSVTVGVVSAVDRQVASEDQGSTRCIQTDAAINPGNSGGALLNAKGEVIGINSIKYASESVEGMGYAIPISSAIPIIESLSKYREVPKGEQAYLGIIGKDLDDEVRKKYDMPKGVYISQVAEKSPAENAGMKKGDIITKIDGKIVASMSDVENILRTHKSGDKADVVVMRDADGKYKETTLNVTFGSNK